MMMYVSPRIIGGCFRSFLTIIQKGVMNMCSAFDLYESSEVCGLIRQLGALYDKQREQGKDKAAIQQERRRVSAQLIRISAKYESRCHLTRSESVISIPEPAS